MYPTVPTLLPDTDAIVARLEELNEESVLLRQLLLTTVRIRARSARSAPNAGKIDRQTQPQPVAAGVAS